jgi:hypothetical protein
VKERTEAIVELLSDKATLDQWAFRFGVHPKTVEKWGKVALEGIEHSMRQGSGKTKRELELERKLKGMDAHYLRSVESRMTDVIERYTIGWMPKLKVLTKTLTKKQKRASRLQPSP